MYLDKEYNPNKHYDADYRGEQVQGNPAVLAQLSLPFEQSQKLTFTAPVVKTKFVSVEEFEELKESINDSFSECVSLILEQKREIDMLLERLDIHNRRASHKI